jgi:CBS domain-containing protein
MVAQMSLCVRDVMARRVLLVEASSSAKNAARMMNKFSVSSLIVSSEGDIVGIVTERDILTRVVASGQNPEVVTVREIMSEPIIVVNPDTPLEQAVQIMLMERIKKLPVMEKDGENVKLVGILSMTDVARIQPHLIENIKNLTQKDDPEIELGFYVR